jgi:hypothetical protein
VERVEFIDLHRRTIATHAIAPGAGHTVLDVSGLASGLVFVRLVSPDGRSGMRPLMLVH